MKEHLALNVFSIACGRTGRKNQVKGVITGYPPSKFKLLPVEDRCKRCEEVFIKHQAKGKNND